MYQNKISESKEEFIEIQNLAQQEFVNYKNWTTKEGIEVSDKVIYSTCFILSAACPSDNLKESRELGIKLTLWIFRLDDLFDSNSFSNETLKLFIRDCQNILEGNPAENEIKEEGFAKLQKVLTQIVEKLSSYSSYEFFKEHFTNYTIKMLEGMLNENNNVFNDLNSYLESGKYTIGAPVVVTAITISLDDKSIQSQYKDLDRIKENTYKALRLSNDLRTYKKELEEGKINAMTILFKNKSVEEAEKYLEEEINKYSKKYFDEIDRVKTEKKLYEFVLPRLFDISVKLYSFSFLRKMETGDFIKIWNK